MHIPDGFLSIPVAAAGCAVAAVGVGLAVKATNKRLDEKQIPLMGVSAAFIFAAQMLNFPIVGGTSGHFLGAALAAILLGPWAGLLVMTCVLLVQCLIFQDGGLFALGANIFNMGIVGSFVSYYIYRGVVLLFGGQRRGKLLGGGIAAWFSVVMASAACAVELSTSGTVPLSVALPAMSGVHALIGIAEGFITATVLGLVAATRSDLLDPKGTYRRMHHEA